MKHTLAPMPEPLHPVAPTPPSPGGAPTRRLDSRDLLAGATEVEIHHHGVCYRLRHTAQGKLILTK